MTQREQELAQLSPVALLREAEQGGLQVLVVHRRLVVRGPRQTEQSLVQGLLARKAELMPLLSLSEDEEYLFEERAGIAEYDGGLSLAAAEQLAWEEILAHRQAARRESRPEQQAHC